MSDRPLIRDHGGRPSKFEHARACAEDQWMLDRWAVIDSHRMRNIFREQRDTKGRVVELVYRLQCSCGWRSTVESGEPMAAIECPVYEALRRRELSKKSNRIQWKEISE